MNLSKEDLLLQYKDSETEDLVKIAYLDSVDYLPEAVEAAILTLEKRGIAEDTEKFNLIKDQIVEARLSDVDESEKLFKYNRNILPGENKYHQSHLITLLWVSVYIILWSEDLGLYVPPVMVLHFFHWRFMEKRFKKKIQTLQDEKQQLYQQKSDSEL